MFSSVTKHIFIASKSPYSHLIFFSVHPKTLARQNVEVRKILFE